MEFELNKEQKEIQKAVRDFVKGEFKKETVEELVEQHAYPEAIWKKAADLGFIGIHFPEAYSGQGLGVMENILVAEELCRGDSSVGACLILADFASEILLHFGSDAQKRKWLPKVAEGEVLSCGAFTEPNHGSDITRMDTVAVRDGDDWVINGTKIFITNGGPLAGFYSVLCQTDEQASPGYRGQSLILVEADRPGVGTQDVGRKMGIQLMHTAEVTLNNVRVPADNTIGKEGRGFYQVLEFFDESRVLIAAQALGTAQGAFDRALAYVKGREQFGKKIAQFQATQHKLADMATKIELARLVTYKAAWNFDQGRIDPKLTSMAKMYRGAHGGGGLPTRRSSFWEATATWRSTRWSASTGTPRSARLYEGTKEIQKNTIASAVLGKLK